MAFIKNTTYLFVDGSNFRQYFNDYTQKWFEQEVEFDFQKIKHYFLAEKAFYYDCIDDIKRDSETDQEFEERKILQEEKLNRIREVEGCHVHLGSLRKAKKLKKRGQKEVDVMLAVQMMEHAFRGNMNKAVLLSGDLDFRPLVESLVRFGLFVEIAGDKNHISSDLIHSADSHRKLDFNNYFQWTSDSLKIKKPLEINTLTFFPERASEDGFHCIKKGICNNSEIKVFIRNGINDFWLYTPNFINKKTALVINNTDNSILKVNSKNLLSLKSFQKLDLYHTLMYGEIDWVKD